MSLVAGVRCSFRGKDAGSSRAGSPWATENAASGRAAPPGCDCGEAAAPRHELHFPVLQKRLVDVDSDPPDKPQMRRRSPAGLLDVVDRDVLKQACQRVEPNAAARVDVGEPHAPARRECPPMRRDRDRWIEHPGEPIRRPCARRTLPLQSTRLVSRQFACFSPARAGSARSRLGTECG